MPNFGTYYINAVSFNDATAIYTDATLTTTAPDGVYQFNGVHRTMTGGVLGSVFYCDTCCAGCSSTYIYPIPPAKNRYHEVCSNIGQPLDVAVVIKFKFTSDTPQYLGYPLGLVAEFDNQFYYGVVSNRFGYLPQTYVGHTTGPNLVVSAADLEADSPYTLDGWAWQPLTSAFVETQDVPAIINASMVNSSANNPDECYLLVPKRTLTSTVNAHVFSPHRSIDSGGGGCDITIPCPSALPSYSTTDPDVDPSAACSLGSSGGYPNKYFLMRVNSSSGAARLYDRIFEDSSGGDATGYTPISAGYYGVLNEYTGTTAGAWINVDSDGIVQAAGTCGVGAYPKLTEMISSQVRLTDTQACAYQNILGTNLPDQQYWHNGANDAPALGNSVFSDVLGQNSLADGWYQLMRQYMLIEVSGGVVVTISNCT
jgi:hypothetical protein